MNSNEFREFGKATIDYVADYIDKIKERNVLPDVKPGYLKDLLPMEAPILPDHWSAILPDIEKLIMPGITHWHSPRFNAYYPTGMSFPSIIGEILSAGIGCIGFSWISSPACTELEVIVLDWLVKMLDLPEHFLSSSSGPGGGVIQGSASEATFIALLVARHQTIQAYSKNINVQENSYCSNDIHNKLTAYTSDQSNSSIEKAGLLGSVTMRQLQTDNEGRLRGSILQKAIEEDRKQGLIPFYVVATLGTTGTCAFDDLDEIGKICFNEKIWLHVDAAYAGKLGIKLSGSAFICPEYRYLMKGIEYADSICINPHKWLLVNFDCTSMWFKNSRNITEAFDVERTYLKDQLKETDKVAPNYRNWQIPLGRRFRSLKLWITLRLYGLQGLQNHIRKQCQLAKRFESHVKNNERFEHISTSMGLVCFKLKGDDDLNQSLLNKINLSRQLYLVAGNLNSKLILRYAICSQFTSEIDVDFAWNHICSVAEQICHI